MPRPRYPPPELRWSSDRASQRLLRLIHCLTSSQSPGIQRCRRRQPHSLPEALLPVGAPMVWKPQAGPHTPSTARPGSGMTGYPGPCAQTLSGPEQGKQPPESHLRTHNRKQ